MLSAARRRTRSLANSGGVSVDENEGAFLVLRIAFDARLCGQADGGAPTSSCTSPCSELESLREELRQVGLLSRPEKIGAARRPTAAEGRRGGDALQRLLRRRQERVLSARI